MLYFTNKLKRQAYQFEIENEHLIPFLIIYFCHSVILKTETFKNRLPSTKTRVNVTEEQFEHFALSWNFK